MNTLNPRWNDFLFDAHELNGNDKELKLMFQIYDDDGKKGADAKDKLIGTGYFNLKELEAACMMQAPLAISDGKRSKPAGYLIVNQLQGAWCSSRASWSSWGPRWWLSRRLR